MTFTISSTFGAFDCFRYRILEYMYIFAGYLQPIDCILHPKHVNVIFKLGVLRIPVTSFSVHFCNRHPYPHYGWAMDQHKQFYQSGTGA